MPHSVVVLDLPRGMRTGLALSLDVLEGANRASQALEQPRPFEVQTLQPPTALPDRVSVLVLPGLGCLDAAELDEALASAEGQWAITILQAAHRQGAWIATSCASVFLAAAAGLLDGRPATTSWFLASELRARHPAIKVRAGCILVESGALLTGGAALAHADVMLALVEGLAGSSVADLCARYLLLDRRQSQRPYVVLTAQLQQDPQLLKAEAWIRAHLSETFRVADVAHAAGLGPRTLARRLQRTCGLTPVQFIQRLRVDAAHTLIAEGLSVEAASAEVGYGDASALRRVIRQHRRGP